MDFKEENSLGFIFLYPSQFFYYRLKIIKKSLKLAELEESKVMIMKKRFNVTGTCIPQKHYMVNIVIFYCTDVMSLT